MVVMEAAWLGGSGVSLLALGFLACCGDTQQQQQQILNVGDDDPQRVCPDCGMENPREANYCGDCGFTFKTGRDDTDE